jgi:hypothetical protein
MELVLLKIAIEFRDIVAGPVDLPPVGMAIPLFGRGRCSFG